MKLRQRAAATGLAVSVMFGAGLVTATAAQAKVSHQYLDNSVFVSATTFAECNKEVNKIAKEARLAGLRPVIGECESMPKAPKDKRWFGSVDYYKS